MHKLQCAELCITNRFVVSVMAVYACTPSVCRVFLKQTEWKTMSDALKHVNVEKIHLQLRR